MSRLLTTAIIALAALGGSAWLGLGAANDRAPDAGRAPAAQGPGEKGHARCPKHVAALGPDAIARATDATLEDAATLFRVKDRRGMRAISAQIASDDNRGAYARVTCGRRVFRRTVVVTVHFPAEEPSASLSSSTVLVSSIRGRWKVWEIVH